ncbi:MAG: DUF2157 domain-containing protein [Desulfovibrio sp.]|nr:DUF2157 domain-containing protein [Desulfovibrio sp.]
MVLLVAGIIFFIAANWNGMRRFARFGLSGTSFLSQLSSGTHTKLAATGSYFIKIC